MMELDGATVTGNIAGHVDENNNGVGKGGGIFTLTNLTLRGFETVDTTGTVSVESETRITGNLLRTEEAEDAAGLYLKDGVKVHLRLSGEQYDSTVETDMSKRARITVTGNLTVDGKNSNLRLPDKTNDSEIVNDISVMVYCGVDGEVRVVNAKKKLTQFGYSQSADNKTLKSPAGFTDAYKVFWSEDGQLFGIVDRQDSYERKIIWGGDPICKITDANGRLLYLDEHQTRPAVFDRLDALTTGHSEDTSTTSAFSTLRSNTQLYYAEGVPYTGNVFQVKMLIEEYTAEYYMEITGGTDRQVTLTTAKTSDSLYPYRGREGTRCTITRDKNMDGAHALVTAKTNLTLERIVLDGGSLKGVQPTGQTRVIRADCGEEAPISIALSRNATVQNAEVIAGTGSDGNGGGVYLDNGAQLSIAGGTIRNCAAVNGGAVYIDGDKGTMTMTVGTITKCSASQNGGGVFFNKGTVNNQSDPTAGLIRISGGSITRCTAENGGGIYLNDGNSSNGLSRQLYMSGGSVSQNSVTGIGGGIYVGDGDVRIYFSGAPYVYQNTSSAAAVPKIPQNGVGQGEWKDCIPPYANACNVQMDQGFQRNANNPPTVIVSRGLTRGASIGVYVPGDAGRYDATDPVFDGNATLYDKHGAEMDPFATFEGSSNKGLNYFVNDRNGMKGGQKDNATTDDQKIYWRIIYALTVRKQVLSDDQSDNNSYFSFKVELSGQASDNGRNVTASEINGKYGDMTFTKGVAFFGLQNGGEKTADLLPLGFDYTVTETNVDTGRFMTTVEYWDSSLGETVSASGTQVSGHMNVAAHYTYIVTFSNLHAVCKIVGVNNESHDQELLYTHTHDEESNTDVYTPAIYAVVVNAFNKVNQNTTWYYKNTNGGFEQFVPDTYRIEMLVGQYDMATMAGGDKETVSVLNGRNVVFTTAQVDADDGFPYVGGSAAAVINRAHDQGSLITVTNGSLTLERITMDGNGAEITTTADGNLVQVKDGASLTVGTGATLKNAITAGSYQQTSGAAIYLAQGSTMYISGKPSFENNLKTNAGLGQDPVNGVDTNVYANGTAHQDIYIAGYENAHAASLVVTGDITSGPGSIWIWAEQSPHYIRNRQFAVMSGGPHNGLDAFRNARPNSQTQNAPTGSQNPKYLYGVARGTDVYWSGCVDLTITKTVTGDFADPTRVFDFTVRVPDLAAGDTCDVIYYTTADGTNWVMNGDASTLTAYANSALKFSLTHYQKIVISIPAGCQVTITEATGVDYVPSYVVGTNESMSNHTVTLTLNDDTTVAFTNLMNAPSPSGVSFRTVPFALMLIMGLLLPAVMPRRRRRKEEE